MVRAILAGPMLAHRSASRLLAALLTVTWGALALVLLATPGMGGHAGLVLGLGALVPALSAAGAIAFPVGSTGRRGWAVPWLGVSALLLAVPFAILVGEPLLAGTARPIVPSAGVAYAGLLGVLATIAYTAHGWLDARRTPRDGPREMRHVQATLIGVVLAGVVGAADGAALATSELSLAGVPSDCDETGVAQYARVTIDARGEIDGAPIATASVSGERSGQDEHWTGAVGGDVVEERAYEYTLAGARALLRLEESDWQPVGESDATVPGHLDRRVASILAGPDVPPVEDLGLELVDGAPARHCRISVGGTHAVTAFLPLGWLLGRSPLDRRPALEVWRGDLNWWSFAGGQLGRATVLIGGHPSDAWPSTGLRGTLRAEMRVVERDVPRTIEWPLP